VAGELLRGDQDFAPPRNINYRYLDRELVHILTDKRRRSHRVSTPASASASWAADAASKIRLYVQVHGGEEAQGSGDGVAEYEDLIAAHAPRSASGGSVR